MKTYLKVALKTWENPAIFLTAEKWEPWVGECERERLEPWVLVSQGG